MNVELRCVSGSFFFNVVSLILHTFIIICRRGNAQEVSFGYWIVAMMPVSMDFSGIESESPKD